MRLQAWLYVSVEEGSDYETTIAKVHALGASLRPLADARPGLGYLATALLSTADFDKEDIERELVESVSNGKLPVIFLNVTYDRDRLTPPDPAVDAVLAEFHFQHAATDPKP